MLGIRIIFDNLLIQILAVLAYSWRLGKKEFGKLIQKASHTLSTDILLQKWILVEQCFMTQ